ncbi:MAG TPA: hypothetical protein VGR21_03570 [Cryptosporangiaceae bacterium]|nr:hypothetical protein [Cryptosporangiaceae bacterium]
MQPMKCPEWCDPRLCTADPAATTAAGYRKSVDPGMHRSAPRPCAQFLQPWLVRQGCAGEDVTIQVSRSVAPWRCSTLMHVRVGTSEEVIEVPTETAAEWLRELEAMLAAADGEVEL